MLAEYRRRRMEAGLAANRPIMSCLRTEKEAFDTLANEFCEQKLEIHSGKTGEDEMAGTHVAYEELVDDALGMLEDVEVTNYHDYQ
jgi:hypothetical protein